MRSRALDATEPPDVPIPGPADEMWRATLTSPSRFRRVRRLHSRIPSSPRCRMCAAPFGGIGGVFMPLLGRRRWARNPRYCTGCFQMIRAHHGGAEIECTLLFADVRGSTPLGEQLRPREFTRLIGRFHDRAASVLVGHEAIVDSIGDEVVGIFIPALASEAHASRAIDAAQALLTATGHADAGGPWIPVGVGVHTGIAYVGSVGEGLDAELRAMGDVVNTTARLSSAAGQGEILVTAAAARSSQLPAGNFERRSLPLKGKSEPVEVLVLHVAPT